MVTKSQLKAQYKYDKDNTKKVILKFNNTNDADILATLASKTNKQGYIKSLIRNDIRGNSKVLTLDSIKTLLFPIVMKYSIKSLSVFGSYARNEANINSDVDILIDGGNYNGLFEYEKMISSMKEALGKNVDLLTQSALNRNSSKSDSIFRKNVERDKVVLYETKRKR